MEVGSGKINETFSAQLGVLDHFKSMGGLMYAQGKVRHTMRSDVARNYDVSKVG